MSEVFSHELKPWSYTPIVPQVLYSTTLPLPPPNSSNQLPAAKLRNARPPHDAAYWAAKLQGFDFKHSDHLDVARFNRVLWEGMKRESVPYPTVRSGRDLRANREPLLAAAKANH